MASFEKIYVCAHSKCEDDEQDILSDFSMLEFESNACNNSCKINYNDGQEANPFDKIAKYYGRGKNVFLFNSSLKNEEFSQKIMDLIKEKCDSAQQEKFIERTTLYLNRIKKGENDAKEFLNNDSFSDAFFNGYHCGENKNIHENLNVNFTSANQFLDMENIFNLKIDAMLKENSFLRRVKIYDNGHRAATVVNDESKRKYTFVSDSSCQLVVKNGKYTIFLDIIAGKVINVELDVDGKKTTNSREVLLKEEIMNNEALFINQKSLRDVLVRYFGKERIDHDDSALVQDECLPIKTLDGLYTWKPSTQKHVTEHLRINFVKDKEEEKNRPKTLVCHDMKGGYLEDRFINGTNGEDNYFFVHWQNIDIFVYFSHYFVTIPPCTWISAAHKNGVQILGTFITEWDDGSKICKEFFKDEKTVHMLSMQLVKIAVHYNFDGWLINIENKLKTCQIPLVKEFVSFLTSNMHYYSPGSKVIWYDSVIKNGELKWQNALNDSNRMFFLACDGIFLNYNWKEEHLLRSLKEAGDRKADVYVGVDVFGRGCLGGGGFSTDIAVAEARRFGLSVAIFAPGWVHECLDVKDFKENQFKFWESLQKFCLKESFIEGPILSTFCPGYGKKMFKNGTVALNKPWYNLGLQSLQPIYFNQGNANGSMQLCDNDAYNGGGCISLSGDIINGEPLKFIIIHTCPIFTTSDITCTCFVSYTFKPLLPNTEMVLVVTSETDEFHLIGEHTTIEEKFQSIRPTSKEQVLTAGYTLEKMFFKDKRWITRTYVVGKHVFEGERFTVSAKLTSTDSKNITSSPVSALLGELQITLTNLELTCKDLVLKREPGGYTKVQCTLEYNPHPSIVYSDIYIVTDFSEDSFINSTSQFSYKLEHVFPKEVSAFKVDWRPYSSGTEKFPNLTKEISLVTAD